MSYKQKRMYPFILILICVSSIHGFIVDPIDSSILSIYSSKYQSSNKLDAASGYYLIEFGSFFEQQCILECLRNLNCAKYEFVQDEFKCRILINKEKENNPVKQDPSSLEFLHCKCTDQFYCAPSTNSTGSSCFCSGFPSTSQCSYQKVYELSAWNDWTSCSTECNTGFQSRQKTCSSSGNDPVNLNLNEWLCDSDTGSLEIKTCKVKSCDSYLPWSEWSECSRLCGGVRIRARQCSSSTQCEYLSEKEPCSVLSDCRNNNPSKYLSFIFDLNVYGYLSSFVRRYNVQ